MVNKIISRRGKRIKYSKRKRFSKYRKHYTRKFVKKFQRRVKRRRQTRNKRGGVFCIPPPNKVKDIIYQGYALVTKQGWGPFGTAIGAKKDRPEQILIFISTNNSIYILRCVDDESDPNRCENTKNVQMMGISLDSLRPGPDQNEFFFKSLDTQEKYGIKLVKREETDKDFEQSVQNFINKVREEKQRVDKVLRLSSSPSVSSKQAQGISGENVKIKSINILGKETLKDANALISITGKTDDPDYHEDIYSLVINGEDRIKFLLRRDNGFKYNDENDKVIDETCYRLYTFTDMDDVTKSIQIYVPVSREKGSLFYILQLGQVGTEDDILNLCGQEYY